MVEGTANTEQGELGAVIYFIEYGGNVYQFAGLSSARAISSYRSRLVQAIESFAPLRDSRILNTQPVRLQVVRASRTASFSQLAQGYPLPPGFSLQELAILNQVEVNETIQAGTSLKMTRQ